MDGTDLILIALIVFSGWVPLIISWILFRRWQNQLFGKAEAIGTGAKTRVSETEAYVDNRIINFESRLAGRLDVVEQRFTAIEEKIDLIESDLKNGLTDTMLTQFAEIRADLLHTLSGKLSAMTRKLKKDSAEETERIIRDVLKDLVKDSPDAGQRFMDLFFGER